MIKKELANIICKESKNFISSYSTLQTALISVMKIGDADLANEVFNGVVAVFLEQFGLDNIFSDEQLYEDFVAVVEEKKRVVKTLIQVFFLQVLEKNIVDNFMTEIDSIVDKQILKIGEVH